MAAPTNPFESLLGGQTQQGNPFDSLASQPGVNPFGDLIGESQPQSGGFLKTTLHSLGGVVGGIGKVLSAPQRATTGVETKLLEKAGVLKNQTPGTGIVAGVKGEMSNIDLLHRIGNETGKGGLITGQYNPTTSVFGNFIRELPSAAIGTVADVFLDPLTVLGKAGKIGEATKAIGSLAKEGAVKAAEEIPAVQKIGEMLGKAFITRYGQSEEFQALDKGRKVAESAIPEKIGKLTSDIIEKPAFIQQRIAQVIKGGITTKEEIHFLAQPIRDELDRVGESISNLNPKLLSEDTFAANKGTYFPRLYTDYEIADNALDTTFGSRAVSIPGDSFKPRMADEEFAIEHLKSLPINDVKKMFPAAVLERTDAQLAALQKNYPGITKEYVTTKNLDLGTVKRIAEESRMKKGEIKEAGFPALKRLTELNVVEERQKFFSEVSKLASEEAKPGYIQMSDDKSLGSLAGKFLPAAEYKSIADLRHIPTKTEELYSKALSVWKTFKTAYNPATIARNDITNFLVLNPLGGVGPHRLDIYFKAANEMITKGHLYQLARKEGLEISTQQAAELSKKATRFYKENDGLVKQFFGKASDFNTAVKDFYGSQDKFFKMANFIKGVTEDGMTPTQAMQRAQFHLVDYSEVPEAIDWLRKSPVGIPFISFTYGVSKPLAKTLLERPDKLAAYYKILNGIQSINPMGETPAERQKELDVAPDWIQEGSYLRLPVKDQHGRGQYVDLQYILPFNIVEAKGLTPSNPILGIFSSIFLNKDAFTGKEITSKTDTSVEKIEKVTANILAQLLPSGTPLVGNSFNKIKSMLQGRPDRNGFIKGPLQTMVDVLGGIKVTPIDPTLEAQKRASEKQHELQDLHSELIKIYTDKSMFPDEQDREAANVRDKISKVYPAQSILSEGDIQGYINSLNE